MGFVSSVHVLTYDVGLVENNILSVEVHHGEKVVTAFSPLYLSAFRDILSHDMEFVLGMDKFCKEVCSCSMVK